jgi:hypothetical protein
MGTNFRMENGGAKQTQMQNGIGTLLVKKGARGFKGSPGLMTSPAQRGYADQALKRDIDFEFMQNKKAIEAAEGYDMAMKIFGDAPPNTPWEKMYDLFDDKNEARNAYWNQERCRLWKLEQNKDFENFPFGFSDSPDMFLCTREEYIERARKRSITTYAVVKDGKWYQKGEMGWWGMSSDEMTQDEWNDLYYKMLDELPDNTLLSVYDCHI